MNDNASHLAISSAGPSLTAETNWLRPCDDVGSTSVRGEVIQPGSINDNGRPVADARRKGFREDLHSETNARRSVCLGCEVLSVHALYVISDTGGIDELSAGLGTPCPL